MDIAGLIGILALIVAAFNSAHTWWIAIIGFIVAFIVSDYTIAPMGIFFLVSSIVGWWLWLKGNHGSKLPVRRMSSRARQITAGLGIVVAIGYVLLYQYTNQYVVVGQAAIYILTMMGQLLLMRRMLETWVFWLIINLINAALFFTHGLNFSTLYYGFQVAICLFGLWYWHRKLESKVLPHPSTINNVNENRLVAGKFFGSPGKKNH
jgi:nicotinamide mononucleotide transporter